MNNLYDATMKALENGLCVRLIGTPLLPNEGMIKKGCSDQDILAMAGAKGFSQIFIYDQSQGSDSPWWIEEIALVNVKSQVITRRRPVVAGDLISDGTTIEESLLTFWQENRTFFLLLGANRTLQVVTAADFDKLPVRVFLNTLLCHFEGLLADVIEQHLPNDQWFTLLNEKARAEVLDRFAMKTKDSFETTKLNCTTLGNKSTIIEKSETLRAALHAPSRKAAESMLDSTKKIRNLVTHDQSLMTKDVPVEQVAPVSSMELLRDHIAHGQTLPQGKSVAWFAKTVCEIRKLVERLSEMDEGKKLGG